MQPLTTKAQARKALAKALRSPGRTQVWLAKVLGVRQSAVSNWISGRYRPDDRYRSALQVLFGIPADAWLSPEERAALERVDALSPFASTETD